MTCTAAIDRLKRGHTNFEKDQTNKFVDLDFTPRNAIYWVNHRGMYKLSSIHNSPENWKRVTELDGATSLFGDSIRLSDIEQGRIGDCWLMSAIASLSENEQLVRNMFTQTEKQKEGIYCLTMYPIGIAQEVCVDDKVMINKYSKRP